MISNYLSDLFVFYNLKKISFGYLEVVDSKNNPLLKPDSKHPAIYPLPAGGLVNLVDGKKISAGEVIAKMPMVASKTKDITGGLPRVADLFEALPDLESKL